MPRPKTLPRIEVDGISYIEILRTQSLRKLAVGKIPTRDMLAAVVEEFYKNTKIVQEFFKLQADVDLSIEEDGDEFVWAVPESASASSLNHVYTRRAQKYEKLVIERTNAYARRLSGAYYEIGESART